MQGAKVLNYPVYENIVSQIQIGVKNTPIIFIFKGVLFVLGIVCEILWEICMGIGFVSSCDMYVLPFNIETFYGSLIFGSVS